MAPENGVSRDKNNDRILNYKAVLSTLHINRVPNSQHSVVIGTGYIDK